MKYEPRALILSGKIEVDVVEVWLWMDGCVRNITHYILLEMNDEPINKNLENKKPKSK